MVSPQKEGGDYCVFSTYALLAQLGAVHADPGPLLRLITYLPTYLPAYYYYLLLTTTLT